MSWRAHRRPRWRSAPDCLAMICRTRHCPGFFSDRSGHPVFRRIAAGGHSDFLAVERSVDENTKKRRNEIVVGDVRAIASFLSMTPGEGDWRVVIIDAADEMNGNAANAVLKVLEEPPKQALILLVAHNPARLLPTMRSRCRLWCSSPCRTQPLEDLLTRYAPDVGADDLARLAALADGSIGQALVFAGNGGLEIYEAANELLAHLPKLDIRALHKLGDKLARDRSGEEFRTLAYDPAALARRLCQICSQIRELALCSGLSCGAR